MSFLKNNLMGIVFVGVVFTITCFGAWSNEKMEYNEKLEKEEYLSANLY